MICKLEKIRVIFLSCIKKITVFRGKMEKINIVSNQFNDYFNNITLKNKGDTQ